MYNVGDLLVLKNKKDNSYEEVVIITEQFGNLFMVYEPNTNKQKGIPKAYLKYYEKVV